MYHVASNTKFSVLVTMADDGVSDVVASGSTNLSRSPIMNPREDDTLKPVLLCSALNLLRSFMFYLVVYPSREVV